MKNNKNKHILFFFLFTLLFLAYFFLIWTNFRTSLSNISLSFGYLDSQNNWRGLEEFVNFGMPFKDYFYEYGWFFLFLQSQAYLFFGRTFLAVLISAFLYLPLVGLFLSYIVAVNILKKKHLILIFLFFSLLFKVNYGYTSARYLVAELSLSFFILYLLQNKKKYLLISGIISGLAVLTALEYGIALNIAIIFIFLLSFFSKIKLKKHFFNKFLLGQLAVLFPYFFWLFIRGTLRNYWEFTYGFINNFYHASPCGGSFPRLPEIITLAPASKLLIFSVPIEFLQRLNFYIVFGFFMIYILISFIIFFKKRRFSRKNLAKLSLGFYGVLIFIRTLDNPCVGYFVFGLVPFFLLVTFLIEEIFLWTRKKEKFALKVIGIFGIAAIFFWFILTENTGYIIKIFGKQEEQIKKDTYEREFYPPAGWFIKKDFAKGYKEIASFIMENTNENDFLFVYPWGVYNNLTDRKAPNSITSAHQFLAGEQFMLRTKTELEMKKPKFIAVNIYNNLGIAVYGKIRKDVNRYFSLGYEDGPVFAGEGNIIETYILENYEPVFKNNVAVMMKQRQKPIVVSEKKKEKYVWKPEKKGRIELKSMEKENSSGFYKILGKKASWILVFEKPVLASDITVELKLDGDFLTKHLTRYFLNFYALTASNGKKESRTIKTRYLARKTWQTAKIEFDQPEEIKTLKIEIGDNTGLVWWLNPHTLAIRKISFYEYF